jgi:hypothetical protein
MMKCTCQAGTPYPSGVPEVNPDFSGVRIARSLVFSVMFCTSLIALLFFFFGHCIVCPSYIYGFQLSLWYLQTFLPVLQLFIHDYEEKFNDNILIHGENRSL